VFVLAASIFAAPSSAVPGGTYILEGNIHDKDNQPIQNALVTVTDISLNPPASLTDYTDANGDWSVDLDDLSGNWADNHVIEIVVERGGEVLVTTYENIYDGVAPEDVAGIAQQIRFIAQRPASEWVWSPDGSGNYISAYYVYFPWFPLQVQANLQGQVTLQADMRFEDERDIDDFNPDASGKYRFYVSDTTDEDANGKFLVDHASNWVPFSYSEAPYDTGWDTLSIPFTAPFGTQNWYCSFEHANKFVIGWPFPNSTEWWLYGASDRATWTTSRPL
jgi:hypothetical protein